MKAMILKQLGSLEDNPQPLELADVPDPVPGEGQILIRVSVCGVCHTELDEIEGRAAPPHLPVIPGHQVVGRVVAIRGRKGDYQVGDRVGVSWIFSTCGACEFCVSGRENLCPDFQATGKDANGGYAQYLAVGQEFALRIPDSLADSQAAPLLCAGAIGYRSLRLTGLSDGARLGLTGFGASGHLILKMARELYPRTQVYVFARDPDERAFALELGAAWAGEAGEKPPQKLDAVIDTTPAWKPVLSALEDLKPGGRLVINAIRKEQSDQELLLGLDYPRQLWLEKEIKSVANLTRADLKEFLALAARAGICPQVQEYPLEGANQALVDLKAGGSRGAKVLRVA